MGNASSPSRKTLEPNNSSMSLSRERGTDAEARSANSGESGSGICSTMLARQYVPFGIGTLQSVGGSAMGSGRAVIGRDCR